MRQEMVSVDCDPVSYGERDREGREHPPPGKPVDRQPKHGDEKDCESDADSNHGM